MNKRTARWTLIGLWLLLTLVVGLVTRGDEAATMVAFLAPPALALLGWAFIVFLIILDAAVSGHD